MAGILDVTACRPREWDSAFFGLRIAQVASSRPAAGELARVVGQADEAGIDCLYFLADAADAATVRAAEQNGFALVDVRLTLECAIDPAESRSESHAAIGDTDDESVFDAEPARSAGACIRTARASDLATLTALARTSHRNTRFYRDPRFDRDRCDEMYAVWIERSVNGELADVVWVVEADGAARGYLTIAADRRRERADDADDRGSSTIGLVAIDPAYRGRGHGDALVQRARDWTGQRGLGRATVVTQGHNAAAIRFYERAGFVSSRIEFWYHRWRSSSKGGAHAAAR